MVWVDSYFPCMPAGPPRARPAGSVERSEEEAEEEREDAEYEPIYARSMGESREAWLMVVEKVSAATQRTVARGQPDPLSEGASLRRSQASEEPRPLASQAFAKLHGCYEALDGGNTACALTMLSGGVADTELLTDAHGRPRHSSTKLAEMLEHHLGGGFVGAGTPPESAEGLTPGHAYAVLRLLSVGGQELVLLRDPWGTSSWHGSPTLNSGEQGAALRRGEFWMALDDFREHFAMIYHCRVLKTTLQGGCWHYSLLRNQWEGATAGGCPNYRSSWDRNPQCLLRVLRAHTQLVLVLTQSPPCTGHFFDNGPGARHHPIGLVLLHGTPATASNISASASAPGRARAPLKRGEVVGASKYVRASHVCLELELQPRDTPYALVASTFAPGQVCTLMRCDHSGYLHLCLFISISIDFSLPLPLSPPLLSTFPSTSPLLSAAPSTGGHLHDLCLLERGDRADSAAGRRVAGRTPGRGGRRHRLQPRRLAKAARVQQDAQRRRSATADARALLWLLPADAQLAAHRVWPLENPPRLVFALQREQRRRAR